MGAAVGGAVGGGVGSGVAATGSGVGVGVATTTACTVGVGAADGGPSTWAPRTPPLGGGALLPELRARVTTTRRPR
jgi:hypothetical protein